MKYRCQTQGCAKFGVVYAKHPYDGSESIDCTLCGEACEHLGELESASEPMPEPTNYSMSATCQCEFPHHHGQLLTACLNHSEGSRAIGPNNLPICGECWADHYKVQVVRVIDE